MVVVVAVVVVAATVLQVWAYTKTGRKCWVSGSSSDWLLLGCCTTASWEGSPWRCWTKQRGRYLSTQHITSHHITPYHIRAHHIIPSHHITLHPLMHFVRITQNDYFMLLIHFLTAISLLSLSLPHTPCTPFSLQCAWRSVRSSHVPPARRDGHPQPTDVHQCGPPLVPAQVPFKKTRVVGTRTGGWLRAYLVHWHNHDRLTHRMILIICYN